MVAMDVVRGIDDDAAFFLALDKSDRGQENAVNKSPNPSGEYQDELVVDVGDDLLENCRPVRRDPLVIVIGITMNHVGARAGV